MATTLPTTGTMTGAQFDALPYDEGRKWELVSGELIAVSSPTPRHQLIVARILLAFAKYFEAAQVRGLALPDVEFRMSDEDRVRPDVCLVLGENQLRLDLDKIPIDGAPDLAVEIISPSERASESYEKVRRYLQNGTSEVWQVYPTVQSVQIYRGGMVSVVEADGFITTDLLPGFRVAVSTLFV